MATQIGQPTIEALEQDTFFETHEFQQPPHDIVAYNELRSCADLFRMYREGILKSPEFQREIVWPVSAQTRFIDSLAKQLPIPSMCFSLDYKTQRWEVIDGLQRMWCIVRFLRADDWHLAKLDDVDPTISGQFVPLFKDNITLRKYYTRIENLALPITVIRCDYSKTSHLEYLFTIFHRLNTGAVRLNNQEIRNCIYSGSFNDFIEELDGHPIWLKLTGRASRAGDRYRGRELILRLLAFRDGYHEYGGRLAKFLNDYMERHRHADAAFLDERRDLFAQTVEIVNRTFTDEEQRDMSAKLSVLESVLVGIALNSTTLMYSDASLVQEQYRKLLSAEEFSDEKLREGLSGMTRVLGRMNTAERIFAGR